MGADIASNRNIVTVIGNIYCGYHAYHVDAAVNNMKFTLPRIVTLVYNRSY